MRKVLLVLLSLLLLVIALPSLAQSDELDADCVAYLEQRTEDVGAISDAFFSKTVSELYIFLYTLRHQYEDMPAVPSCATRLHTLTIQLIAANQDAVGLSPMFVTDEELATSEAENVIGPRVQRLLDEVRAELEALGWESGD